MLTVINVPVEIFVIKRLSVLNLVVISILQPRQGTIIFVRTPKIPRFCCKNWRNPQLLVE
jgi:hypothetical protein